MSMETPFNPLDKHNLGVSVAEALLSKELCPLGALTRFDGAGIYCIYYAGGFETYAQISIGSEGNNKREQYPIYVGKAVPPGARKGGFGLNSDPKEALYKRLKEHAESIAQSENLELRDFYCRYLVVDDIWIPLGESLLIANFSPIWNQIIDGFGNHDPGSGRYNQLRSRWDTLHPGRKWALKCKERPEDMGVIESEVKAYLTTRPKQARLLEFD